MPAQWAIFQVFRRFSLQKPYYCYRQKMRDPVFSTMKGCEKKTYCGYCVTDKMMEVRNLFVYIEGWWVTSLSAVCYMKCLKTSHNQLKYQKKSEDESSSAHFVREILMMCHNQFMVHRKLSSSVQAWWNIISTWFEDDSWLTTI